LSVGEKINIEYVRRGVIIYKINYDITTVLI